MPATIHFLSTDLGKWDGAAADALVLTFFSDERPLRGAAGLVDWRLCGRLSRLIKAGRLDGGPDEVTLVPPAGARLPFPRIFVFGLGSSEGFDERRFKSAVARVREVLHKAGIRRYAMQPPGRALGLVAPRRAFELFREDQSDEDEVTLIETPSGQKEMSEAVRRAATHRG
jgi:Cytosol aminopeptidase family, N-terminal domain